MRLALISLLLFLPMAAFAANTSFWGALVPACTEGGDGICQACNLIQLTQNILKFFVSLSVIVAAVMFAYAGTLYVTAAANKQHLESAKKIFINTFLGIVIILTAYLLIDLGLHVLTGQGLKAMTNIACVRAEHGSGTAPISGAVTVVEGTNDEPAAESTGTPTGMDSTCKSGGTLGAAVAKIDGTTHYNPGGGGDAGPDKDAFNGTPYTVSECKAEGKSGAGGCSVCSKPITVALPQDVKLDCKVRGGDQVTWDEYSARNKLCQGTRYILSDSYGCYKRDARIRYDGVNPCEYGRTSTGYSIDVAACAPKRPGAKCYPVSDARGLPPPKPVPPGG